MIDDFTHFHVLQLKLLISNLHPDVDIEVFDLAFLDKSIQERIRQVNVFSVEEYILFVSKNPEEVACLIALLQNNFSVFFRNQLTFSVLEQVILPLIIVNKNITKQKEVRIWSAACAGGQEAYSLAILLEEFNSTRKDKIAYRIVATDQSKANMAEAKNGQFSEVLLHNMSLKRLRYWFTQNEESYAINPELKRYIDFSEFNLLDKTYNSPPESIFGNFDLVFCANLLFYYKSDYRELILSKIKTNLAEGGYLISGETEREILMQNGFREVFTQSAIFIKP